jgi:hypothetical protein
MSDHLVECRDCADADEDAPCEWCGGFRTVPCENPWCECRNNLEEPNDADAR